jgi:hypothetical protein
MVPNIDKGLETGSHRFYQKSEKLRKLIVFVQNLIFKIWRKKQKLSDISGLSTVFLFKI